MKKMMVNDKLKSGENIIEAEYHTLFIEEAPMTFEPLTDPDGTLIEKLYEQVGGNINYKLFIGDFAESANGTHRIINELQNSLNKDATLEIHISSYGGSADEVLEYYNAINSTFNHCVTYLNMGYSAGAIAFLFGTDRVCYEHSDWMIHSYSGGAIGKRDDMLKQLVHTDARLQKFFNDMLNPYFTQEELKEISRGDDFWLDSKKMLERGIATHIISKGVVYSADDYLDNIDPSRVEKRKTLEKEKEKVKAKKAEYARKRYNEKKSEELEKPKKVIKNIK